MTEYNTLADAMAANKGKTSVKRPKHYNIRQQHSNLEPLSPDQMRAKYARCYRSGKTERDAANGSHRRNLERKALRADWQKDNRANPDRFPV